MKPLLLLALALTITATDRTVVTDCTIVARIVRKQAYIDKYYDCKEGVIKLSGDWFLDREFGEYWFGERGSFGVVPQNTRAFTHCRAESSIPDYGRLDDCANCNGYMSTRKTFQCAEGRVQLRGQWGEEFQGHWNYHLEFGEVTMKPDWVEDVKKSIEFSDWMKYCPTRYGYRLCGEVNLPKIDHGQPPPFKRDK